MTRLGYCHPCGENGRPVAAVEMVDGDPHCQPCAMIAKRRLGSAVADAPQPEPKRPLSKPEFCSRGCGRPTHRGQCSNVGRLPQNPRYTHPERVAVTAETPSASTQFRDYANRIDAAIASGTLTRHEDGPLQHKRTVIDVTLDNDLDEIKHKSVAVATVPKGKTMDKLVCEVIDRNDVPQCSPSRTPTGRAGEIWEQVMALPPGKALAIACRDRIHVGTTARDVLAKAKARGFRVMTERGTEQLYVWKVN